jgi:hypothetical protein
MSKVTISPYKRYLKNLSIREFIDSYIYRIDLDADYQREKIWTTKEQELLLDSILNQIDIPKIYLVEVRDNKQYEYECIDGKQRMTTLLRFFDAEPKEESPLTVQVLHQKFTYAQLRKKHLTIAKAIEDYELSLVIYKPFDDEGEYVREIFRRLQLGVRLNSGELLKTRTGTIRDFIYKDIGNDGPFFRKTNLSKKRFSRPFTLAQICINSFARAKPDGEFVRARLKPDLEEFFEEFHDLDKNDENLARIKKVLKLMDKTFGNGAVLISSRAIAVSGFLFVEELVKEGNANLVSKFSQFYLKLLNEIKHNMDLLSNYEKPRNSSLMEEFQKYVLQASVEGYSIQRRHEYLKRAFDFYRDPKTRGRIIGGR